jgi:hypothetical protein
MFFEIFFAVLAAMVVYSVVTFVVVYRTAFKKFVCKLIWENSDDLFATKDDEEEF